MTDHKMIFVLPMWRTLKMIQGSGLLDDAEVLTENGVITADDLKVPPFDMVIRNQPFF